MAPETSIREESLEIPASDGFALASTVFHPVETNGRSVQIYPATAVYRGIYTKYARYLASQGFRVVTFDYRGTGDSLTGSIRDFRGRMRHWGERDVLGVLRWTLANFPDDEPLAVAHSVGGQILGLVEDVDRLERVWAVCAQWGTWRYWPWPRRWFNKVLFHLGAPVATALWGYFPGRLMGMGDLPRDIGLDWMRWCRNDHYIVDDEGRPLRPHYHRLRARVCWNAFSDDHFYGPRRAVEAMPGLYPQAQNEVSVTDPADVGAGPIGHFGFFRSRFRESLWSRSAEWLNGT